MYIWTFLLTWLLGVASKQLRLLHGRVRDSTIVVNSLSPQMSELLEDAIASWCGAYAASYGKGNAPLTGCIGLLLILNSIHNSATDRYGLGCTPKHHQLENQHSWQLSPVV